MQFFLLLIKCALQVATLSSSSSLSPVPTGVAVVPDDGGAAGVGADAGHRVAVRLGLADQGPEAACSSHGERFWWFFFFFLIKIWENSCFILPFLGSPEAETTRTKRTPAGRNPRAASGSDSPGGAVGTATRFGCTQRELTSSRIDLRTCRGERGERETSGVLNPLWEQ